MFQPESVIVESDANRFADYQQHGDIEENGKSVTLAGSPVGQIAQGTTPPGNQEDDQQGQSEREIRHSEPAPHAVVTARLRGIMRMRKCVDSCHWLLTRLSRKGKLRA